MNLNQSNIADHYSTMQIVTASREKQITMLHEKCVEHISKACLEKGIEKRKHLNRAQNILAQFQFSLASKDKISKSLFYLYDYSYVLLESDNDKYNKMALEVMTTLRNTFREALLKI